jgi:hypothetical protein
LNLILTDLLDDDSSRAAECPARPPTYTDQELEALRNTSLALI